MRCSKKQEELDEKPIKVVRIGCEPGNWLKCSSSYFLNSLSDEIGLSIDFNQGGLTSLEI